MQNENSGSIQTFRYPPSGLPLPSHWGGLTEIGAHSEIFEECGSASHGRVQLEEPDNLAERIEKSFQAGKEQGIEIGRCAVQEKMDELLKESERKRIEQAVQIATQAACEQDKFVRSIEPELVRLSLSIAARILRREAEIDPLFLTGAVRVALGQVSEKVVTRLRVPAAEFGLWSETLPHLPGLNSLPALVSDELMHTGEVLIESDMGSADLGVLSQLTEIARLFEDLSPARQPRGRSVTITAEGQQ